MATTNSIPQYLGVTTEHASDGHLLHLYRCPFCSTTFQSPRRDVTSGKTRSCGCYRRSKRFGARTNWIDRRGQQINYCYVIEEAGTDAAHLVQWRCFCTACQNYFIASNTSLTRGRESCGCLAKLKTRQRAIQKYKEISTVGSTETNA